MQILYAAVKKCYNRKSRNSCSGVRRSVSGCAAEGLCVRPGGAFRVLLRPKRVLSAAKTGSFVVQKHSFCLPKALLLQSKRSAFVGNVYRFLSGFSAHKQPLRLHVADGQRAVCCTPKTRNFSSGVVSASCGGSFGRHGRCKYRHLAGWGGMAYRACRLFMFFCFFSPRVLPVGPAVSSYKCNRSDCGTAKVPPVGPILIQTWTIQA